MRRGGGPRCDAIPLAYFCFLPIIISAAAPKMEEGKMSFDMVFLFQANFAMIDEYASHVVREKGIHRRKSGLVFGEGPALVKMTY